MWLFYVMMTDSCELSSFKAAMDGQDSKKWYNTMLSEMEFEKKWQLRQFGLLVFGSSKSAKVHFTFYEICSLRWTFFWI